VWEVDPLACPECGSEMKIIRKILEHLNKLEEEQRIRPLPNEPQPYPVHIREPYDDGWPG
jgi:hypothetical protein